MIQKELGEKLYVSDETVSRWERDECTPDLYLIPAIAVLVAYMVYAFFIRGFLEKKEILFFDEEKKAKIRQNGKLLKSSASSAEVSLYFSGRSRLA